MATTTAAPHARLDDLDWLTEILWPAGTVALPGRSTAPNAQVFVANPAPEACRLLVPIGDRRAASQSVRRYHDGARPRGRAVMAATELALRLGVGGLLTKRAVSIVPPRGDRSAVLDLVAAHVADATGRSVAHQCAITLGPRRFNRKPVVQLFDETGDTIAFAKIGADELTNRMVERESQWLQLAADRAMALLVPAQLWCGNVSGRAVSIIEPCWAGRWPTADTTPDAAMVREIFALADPVQSTVLDGAAAKALRTCDHPTAAAALRAAERWPSAHETVALGAWHGDLTPWNLLTTKRGRVVIDWETAEAGHPLGIDVLHHHVASRSQLTGAAPTAAIGHAVAVLPSLVEDLGLAPTNAVLCALLLEYVRRDIDLGAAGLEVSGLGDAALHQLTAAGQRD